jgi:hypothetical protein
MALFVAGTVLKRPTSNVQLRTSIEGDWTVNDPHPEDGGQKMEDRGPKDEGVHSLNVGR